MYRKGLCGMRGGVLLHCSPGGTRPSAFSEQTVQAIIVKAEGDPATAPSPPLAPLSPEPAARRYRGSSSTPIHPLTMPLDRPGLVISVHNVSLKYKLTFPNYTILTISAFRQAKLQNIPLRQFFFCKRCCVSSSVFILYTSLHDRRACSNTSPSSINTPTING